MGKDIRRVQFQFLYGPIKAKRLREQRRKDKLFQFLYGPIKAIIDVSSCGYNGVFQFLYGPIKANNRQKGDRFRDISIPIWSN